MKKLFLILIIASLGWSLSAQDTLSWKQTLQRHDIYFGIGDPLIAGLSNDRFPLFSKCGHGTFSKCSYDEGPLYATDWFSPDTYSSGVIATPTISIGYKYRLAKWFWLGATASYTGFFETIYDRVSNIKYSTLNSHLLTVMPEVRFSWLNTKYVTLYSGIGLGVSFLFDEIYYAENNGHIKAGYSTDYVGLSPTGQVTFVGIHVGRKWYGFTEIGIGSRGIIQAGFGYNFNSKKK
ncbi:MAG: hypothetical protein J6X16_09840 [Bacteroidales bacterium]|nr:hypothetical protein [Bacteroidales bacterium]